MNHIFGIYYSGYLRNSLMVPAHVNFIPLQAPLKMINQFTEGFYEWICELVYKSWSKTFWNRESGGSYKGWTKVEKQIYSSMTNDDCPLRPPAMSQQILTPSLMAITRNQIVYFVMCVKVLKWFTLKEKLMPGCEGTIFR